MAGTPPGWFLADAVVHGIFVLALFILWVFSLSLVHRTGDPARAGFTWMKIAYPLAFLGFLFPIPADVILILYDAGGYNAYKLFPLLETAQRLDSVAGLLIGLADSALFVTLVELGSGFLYCLRPTILGIRSPASFAILATAVIPAGFALALVIQYNVSGLATAYKVLGGSSGAVVKKYLILEGAFVVAAVVATITTLGFVSYVMARCRSDAALRNSAVLLTVAASLNVLRRAWEVTAWARWAWPKRVDPDYFAVLDLVLDAGPMFVQLVLLFVIGIRKQGGLWSTSQVWTQQALRLTAPVYAAPVTESYPNAYRHSHAGWEPQGTPELSGRDYHQPQKLLFSSTPGYEMK